MMYSIKACWSKTTSIFVEEALPIVAMTGRHLLIQQK